MENLSLIESAAESPALSEPWTAGWPQTREEFEGLVEAFQDRLVWHAFQRLGDAEEAEEAVQDVFLRAFRDREKRKGVARVGPYLYRMTRNACIDRLRRRRPAQESLDTLEADRIPAPGWNAPQRMIQEEEARAAEELLKELPERQAEVVRMRALDDLPLAEIAAILGCPLFTARSRFRYGLERLRKLLHARKEAGK